MMCGHAEKSDHVENAIHQSVGSTQQHERYERNARKKKRAPDTGPSPTIAGHERLKHLSVQRAA